MLEGGDRAAAAVRSGAAHAAAGARRAERRADPRATRTTRSGAISRTPSARRSPAALEQTLRAGIAQASTTSLKSAYFAAFRRTVTTPDGPRLSRARVAAAGADSGADVCGNRFHRHGAGAGAARRGRTPTRFSRSSTRASRTPTGRRASRSSRPRCRPTPRSATRFSPASRASRTARTSAGWPTACDS